MRLLSTVMAGGLPHILKERPVVGGPIPLSPQPVRSRALATACAEPEPLARAGPSFRQRLREATLDRALLAEAERLADEMKRNRGRRGRDREDGPGPIGQFSARPRFVAAAATEASLPASTLPEVAFIGRSNVGKSSLLNKLTGTPGAARVSDKPGRTQQLIFFTVGDGPDAFSLVDMPGYGFALASEEAVSAWQQLSASYLRSRTNLKMVIVLVDARTGLKQTDVQMLQFLESARVNYTLALTKIDLAGPPKRIAQVRI